jgi:hypothetical protein
MRLRTVMRCGAPGHLVAAAFDCLRGVVDQIDDDAAEAVGVEGNSAVAAAEIHTSSMLPGIFCSSGRRQTGYRSSTDRAAARGSACSRAGR